MHMRCSRHVYRKVRCTVLLAVAVDGNLSPKMSAVHRHGTSADRFHVDELQTCLMSSFGGCKHTDATNHTCKDCQTHSTVEVMICT